MHRVTVSEFRANISHYKGLVRAGARIEVTEHGQPAFVVIPPGEEAGSAHRWLQSLAATARIKDVESPIGEAWSAQEDENTGRL
jgi:prevent-host-death family protein